MKKSLLPILLLFCYGGALYGQGAGLVAPVVIPPSPEAASLGKYADFPSATYNGIPDIKIPLYELPVAHLSHSIFLSYQSHGFKVQEEASSVGLGWNLISTGVITRSVNGIDDFSSQGYFRHNPNSFTIGKGRDASPDMFSFNINGRTGRFVINYKPANPGGYEVVLLNQIPLKIEILADTTWKITDEKGAIFTFAQKERTRKEITGGSKTTVLNFVSSWYLSTIQSPQGDAIDFQYYSNPAILKNEYISHGFLSFTSVKSTCNDFIPLPNQERHETVARSFTQQIVLEKISFDKGYLQFGVAGRIDLGYEGSNLPKKIVSLKVKTTQGELIKEFSFHQDYFKSGSSKANSLTHRLRLIQVEERTGEKTDHRYTFDYLPLELPDKDSFAKDYWGFYNGATENTTLFGNREPSAGHSLAGLLKSIRFPTGGKVAYTFEANDYNNFDASKMEEKPPSSVSGGRIGPGCRISKIEFFDESNLSLNSQIYSYSTGSGTARISTGKRMSGSRYGIVGQSTTFNQSCMLTYNTFSQSSENYFSSGDGGPGYEIGYSLVSESMINGRNMNGKKEYFFVNEPNINPHYPGIPTFVSNRNGLVEKVIVYKQANGLIKVEETDYLIRQAANQTVESRVLLPSYHTGSFEAHRYPIPSHWVYTAKSAKLLFDENGTGKLSESTDYHYDNPSHKQKSREYKTLSDGSILINYYLYPLDYGGKEPFIDQMKTNHLIDYPIEQIQTLRRDNQNYILSGSLAKYKTGGQGLKEADYFLETATPLPTASFKFSNRAAGTLPPVGSPSNFLMDARFKPRVFYDSYQKGKLAQYRINTDSHVSFLWAYNGQYAIAEVKNAAQNQISHTSFETAEKGGWAYSGTPLAGPSKTGRKHYSLSTGSITKTATGASAANPFTLTFWARRATGTGPWTFMGSTENLTTAWQLIQREITAATLSISGSGVLLDELRLHPTAAQMATYTYDPLIGITSSTDIRNSTTTYEYDAAGRLKNIKNADGHILQHYQYHYTTGN